VETWALDVPIKVVWELMNSHSAWFIIPIIGVLFLFWRYVRRSQQYIRSIGRMVAEHEYSLARTEGRKPRLLDIPPNGAADE